MQGRTQSGRDRGWTRAGLFRWQRRRCGRGRRRGDRCSPTGGGNSLLAAPSADTDAKILNFFLLLEYLQEALLPRGAPQHAADRASSSELRAHRRPPGERARRLPRQAAGRPRASAAAAGLRRRAEHARSASAPRRSISRRRRSPPTSARARTSRAARVGAVGTLLSVEARQAAWLRRPRRRRRLRRAPPIPRASRSEVLAHLRGQGFIA